MASTTFGRPMLTMLIGAAAYYGLLQLTYGLLESSYLPPSWLLASVPSRSVATVTWFIFLNAAGAILAALPVAFGAVLLVKGDRSRLCLLLGFAASACVLAGNLREYGLPLLAATWTVEVLQFLSIGVAVTVLVALYPRRPLTTGSTARAAGSLGRVKEGR
jgi:hypothetical protein